MFEAMYVEAQNQRKAVIRSETRLTSGIMLHYPKVICNCVEIEPHLIDCPGAT